MFESRLTELPNELLFAVALSCEAPSILSLSQACHKLHTICYSGRLLRARIERTQRLLWEDDCLDLDAVAFRAGSDPEIWARYAIADYLAWQEWLWRTSKQGDKARKPDKNPPDHAAWLPALAVTKHPITKQSHRVLQDVQIDSEAYDFCAILGSILSKDVSLASDDDRLLPPVGDSNFACFLMRLVRDTGALQTLPPFLKQELRTSINEDAQLWPLSHEYNLPLPFLASTSSTRDDHDHDSMFTETLIGTISKSYNAGNQRTDQLIDPTGLQSNLTLGNTTGSTALSTESSCSLVGAVSWKQWYAIHLKALSQSHGFFSDSAWTGIYTHGTGPFAFGEPLHNDARMRDIKLHHQSAESLQQQMEDRDYQCVCSMISDRPVLAWLSAVDCQDSVGRFSIQGALYMRDNGLPGFAAVKRYYSTSIQPSFSWTWHCRLTPFGLLGTWGQWQRDVTSWMFYAMGRVWIWKEAKMMKTSHEEK